MKLPQFSLRGLLLSIALIAIVIACFATTLRRMSPLDICLAMVGMGIAAVPFIYAYCHISNELRKDRTNDRSKAEPSRQNPGDKVEELVVFVNGRHAGKCGMMAIATQAVFIRGQALAYGCKLLRCSASQFLGDQSATGTILIDPREALPPRTEIIEMLDAARRRYPPETDPDSLLAEWTDAATDK